MAKSTAKKKKAAKAGSRRKAKAGAKTKAGAKAKRQASRTAKPRPSARKASKGPAKAKKPAGARPKPGTRVASPKARKPVPKPKATAPALPGEGTFVRHDLMSTDPERSKAFYGELFGWSLEPVSFGGMTLTRISTGGIRQGAIMPFDPSHGIPSHWVPYVCVADVDATCRKVGALGGKVCMGGMEIPVGRFALCEFPEKALFSPFTPKEPRAMPFPPPAGSFCWDELLTPDLPAARAFYAGLLGWKPREMTVPGGAYVVMERGGRQVCGIMESPENAPHPPSWLCYIAVEDVDRTMSHAQQLGAKVSAPPRDIPGIGRFCVLADPTGAAIAIYRAAASA